jgi:hypothetical protein
LVEPTLAPLTVDQKMAVLSAIACGDATTSLQPELDAERKTAVSTNSAGR